MAAYLKRFSPSTEYSKALSNSLNRDSYRRIVAEWSQRETGAFKALLSNLKPEYEHYLKRERPVIASLGGATTWVNSAAAPQAIRVLEKIRQGQAHRAHGL
jgi:hypothetical protein